MKKWLFIHGLGRLSKEYSALLQQTEKSAFLAREFGVNYLDVLEDKNAQHRMHLTAFGARLAWLLFGFILLLAMVLVIIGGR